MNESFLQSVDELNNQRINESIENKQLYTNRMTVSRKWRDSVKTKIKLIRN
jgi:hypothetical protein